MASAVNHVKLGLGKTFGRDYHGDGTTRYLNHPGLLGMTLALLVKVFGSSNAVARILPIIFNAGTLALLLFITAREKVSLGIATVVFFSMPIVILHGRDLVHFAPIMFFLLLALILYLNWRNHLKPVVFYSLLDLFPSRLFGHKTILGRQY